MTDIQISEWLAAHPECEAVTVALCDINGVFRGKRIPVAQADKLTNSQMRMPISAATLDIWGRDIEDSELVMASGDADGFCRATDRGVIERNWGGKPSAMVQVVLHSEDGAALPSDPRQALDLVLERYRTKGLTPIAATEMEFYLTAFDDGIPRPATLPGERHAVDLENVLSVQEIDAIEAFLDDVYAACRVQGIPADAAISENGAGQFEINLMHRDALSAADDAVLFKALVRGIAKAHGFAATFMAKPFGNQSGSGMHVHFSVLDAAGENIFDDGSEAGSDALKHAVGGLIAAMRESTLIFAPHQNSYRRIRPGTHAPTGVAWGYENRTCAIRIPGGAPKARRIEHRVAGADANPYMVLAAILGAALEGIEGAVTPPAPVTGNAYEAEVPSLHLDWPSAISGFSLGDIMGKIFDPQMHRLFAQAKAQELGQFLSIVPESEHRAYLEVV